MTVCESWVGYCLRVTIVGDPMSLKVIFNVIVCVAVAVAVAVVEEVHVPGLEPVPKGSVA